MRKADTKGRGKREGGQGSEDRKALLCWDGVIQSGSHFRKHSGCCGNNRTGGQGREQDDQ